MADKPDEKDGAEQSASTAITKTEEEETPAKGTRQHTAWMVKQYAKKLINDRRAAQFVTAISLMGKRDAKIANATEDSVLAAVMACVHLDLMPNTPEQHAFIIPYRSGAGYIVQFQLGYKGLAELAYRTGQINSISAELVYPEDEFEVELGTDRKLKHKPDYDINRANLENATHVYATAQLANGSTAFEVLSISEIKKIRDKVKAKSGDAPWAVWPEVMAKKTAVKRLLKLLPSSRDDNRAALGSMFDSWAEAGKLAVDDKGEIIEGKKRAADNKKAAEIAEKVEAAKSSRDEQSNQVKDGEKPKEENAGDDTGKATA